MLRRLLAAIAIALGLLLSGASIAAAQGDGGESYVRLAHLSPDTPDVDVYVSSVADPARSFVVPGVGYGAVSAYRALPSGAYVVSMRAAGAPADSPAVISTSVDARPGGAYTIAGVGMSAALGLSVLSDRLDIPTAGTARVRVINGAVSAPSVDVGPAGGPTWVSGVRFATDTAYTDVPLGDWPLQVTAAGRPTVTLPVRLEVNSVYTVLLVDRNGTLVAELIRDSAGSGVIPVGGVETGFGWGATDGAGDPAAGDPAAGDPAAGNLAVLLAGVLIAALGGGLLATRTGAGRTRVH